MKITVSIIALWLCVPALGQTSLADYRAAVADYSWQLKIAASKSDAAAETAGQARTGYLPRLAMDGSFTATVRHFDGVERWTFSLLPQLVQTVYGGGAVRAAARQAELDYGIALCDEEFSRLDVRYAADYAYWNLSAVELYAASMRQYVAIIRSLKEVVDRRFSEGYIAKGDVLMIDARLSEAEYSLVSAEQSYEVALHNFNILRGTDAALGVQLAQGIRDSLPMPGRVVAAEALERRPDYAAARLRSEQAEAGIRAVRAPFNPQLSVGVGGMWQPYYPNSTGATYVDGSAFVKLSVPIFHWGERRRAVGAARAVQQQQEWTAEALREIAACLPAPERLAVENLETYAPSFWDRWLAGTPYSRCLDVGHIWKDGGDPAPVLAAWLPRVRVIHLHGLEPRGSEADAAKPQGQQRAPEKLAERNLSRLFGPRPRDHKSLRLMPPEFVDDVMHPLWKTGFSGVLNLEVFSVEDFTASHAVLMHSWERYAASS